MKPGLKLNIGQNLVMTPMLQQAIRLLQMSQTELETEVESMVLSNPMLDVKENVEAPTALKDYSFSKSSYQEGDDSFLNFTAEPTSLQDHLLWQMNLSQFTNTEQVIAYAIIESINEDGYLTCDLDDIKAAVLSNRDNSSLNLNTASILQVLQKIWQFDPVGVGARDLTECLLIQLKTFHSESEQYHFACTIVKDYITYLKAHDHAKLKQKLRLSEEDINKSISLIKNLYPKPGLLFATDNFAYIIPDVIVYKNNENWVIELNRDLSKNVEINNYYASMVKRADTSRDNLFMKDKLNEARWFMKSLHNRNDTLLKVANSIVKAQHEFLEYGEEYMRPLVLQDVAMETNLHESTISRITTRKYIETPRGTLELKYFFSSHLSTTTGEDYSSTAIKAMIKKLIKEEKSSKPYSDLAISKLLAQKGINIARRTVAKYRESLGIAPSNERKILVK